jgi:hypothetical protein
MTRFPKVQSPTTSILNPNKYIVHTYFVASVENFYQIYIPEPAHMIGYDLHVEPSTNLPNLGPPKKKQKPSAQSPNVIPQDDDDEPPPVILEVTHRERIFLKPAATTATILHQPRKSRRASQAEPERFVKEKLPPDLQKALGEPFGKNNIRQSFHSEVKFRHVLVFIREFLDLRTMAILNTTSPEANLLQKVLTEYGNINCAPIQDFQKNWKDQAGIPEQRTKLFTAALVQHPFNTAALVRSIGGPYTA